MEILEAPANDWFSRVRFNPGHPQDLYLVAHQGLLRSSDGGITFERVSSDVTTQSGDYPVTIAFSADGNTVYYTTIQSKFFRSTDAGSSFAERLAIPNDVDRWSSELAVDPANSQVVYAAGAPSMFQSQDGGASWVPFVHSFVFGVLVTPDASSGPSNVWYSTAQDVFQTTVSGSPLSPSTLNLGGQALFQTAPDTFYVATGSNLVAPLRRHLQGAFQQVTAANLALPVHALVASPSNSQVLLRANSVGVLRSSDGGSSWSYSHSGLFGTNYPAIGLGAAGVLIGTTDLFVGDGVGVAERVPTSIATSETSLRAVAAHPSDPKKMLVGFGGGDVYWTDDAGSSWHQSSGLSGSYTFSIAYDPTDPSRVYASSVAATGYFHRSLDGGKTFSAISSDVHQLTRLKIDPLNPQRLLGLDESYGTPGLYRSDNSGVNWTSILSGTLFDFAIDPHAPSRVYVLSYSDGLLISDSGGASFSPSTSITKAAQGYPIAIAVDPEFSDVVYLACAVSDPYNPKEYRVFRSVDRAQTWEQIPNGSGTRWEVKGISLAPSHPTRLIETLSARGVQSMDLATDLVVSADSQDGSPTVNMPSSLTVHVDNKGSFAGTNVQLSVVTADAQNVQLAVNGARCVTSGSAANCVLPILRAGARADGVVTYTPSKSGQMNLEVKVAGREADSVPGTETVSSKVDVLEVPTASPSPPSTPAPTAPSGSSSTVKDGGGGGGGLALGWVLALCLLLFSKMRCESCVR
jgi:photosystem II stability/assembly factor-like uncharacterized protein